MTNEQLVSKVWNYAHVLRDQGISYGDYIAQLTYLLFLKVDQERVKLLGEPSAMTGSDFDDCVQCYRQRKESERFRRFTYEELAQRDKLNLNIF